MPKPYVSPPPGDRNFPTRRWNPETGESKVCNSAAEVPEGWLSHHPDDKEKLAKSEPARKVAPVAKDMAGGMTREEIVAELESGGISFNKDGKTAALHGQLREAIKKALNELGTTFKPDAETKVLLGLLPKPD